MAAALNTGLFCKQRPSGLPAISCGLVLADLPKTLPHEPQPFLIQLSQNLADTCSDEPHMN